MINFPNIANTLTRIEGALSNLDKAIGRSASGSTGGRRTSAG